MFSLALFFATTGVVFAALRNITVDDTDSSIVYSGNWGTGGATGFVDNTYHITPNCGANSPGATATFRFTGTAVYYVYGPAVCADSNGQSSTTLILDGGSPIVVPLSTTTQTIWPITGLTNGPHTIVDMGSSNFDIARVDAFIYTVDDSVAASGGSSIVPSASLSSNTPSASAGAHAPSPSAGANAPSASAGANTPSASAGPNNIPQPPAGFKNVFLSADDFAFSDGWSVSSDSIPSCVESGHVHQSSTVNSTFSFNFTGDSLFLNTLTSSTGQISLSINNDEPELFNLTSSASDSCMLLNLNATSLVRRSLARRTGQSAVGAENKCVGKTASGTVALDGATYQQASSAGRLFLSRAAGVSVVLASCFWFL